MRIIIITFLFILCGPFYSFADNNKITPDDVQRFIDIKFKNFRNRITQEEYEKYKKTDKYLQYRKEVQERRKRKEKARQNKLRFIEGLTKGHEGVEGLFVGEV